MRRLRVLLSAGPRLRAAGATAPAGVPGHSGGVGRRGLLGLIAAAPIAAPSLAAAALASESSSGAIFFDVDWADYGRACAAWFDANPEVGASAEVNGQIAGIGARLRASEGSTRRFAAVRHASGELARALPVPALLAFLGDVGSGP